MSDDDVRVGDRFDRGDLRATVSMVDGGMVVLNVMDVGAKTTWIERVHVERLDDWTRVGRAPEPPPVVEMCINHPLRERELGTLYCPECVDEKAQDWAPLTHWGGQAHYAALEREAKKRD